MFALELQSVVAVEMLLCCLEPLDIHVIVQSHLMPPMWDSVLAKGGPHDQRPRITAAVAGAVWGVNGMAGSGWVALWVSPWHQGQIWVVSTWCRVQNGLPMTTLLKDKEKCPIFCLDMSHLYHLSKDDKLGDIGYYDCPDSNDHWIDID